VPSPFAAGLIQTFQGSGLPSSSAHAAVTTEVPRCSVGVLALGVGATAATIGADGEEVEVEVEVVVALARRELLVQDTTPPRADADPQSVATTRHRPPPSAAHPPEAAAAVAAAAPRPLMLEVSRMPLAPAPVLLWCDAGAGAAASAPATVNADDIGQMIVAGHEAVSLEQLSVGAPAGEDARLNLISRIAATPTPLATSAHELTPPPGSALKQVSLNNCIAKTRTTTATSERLPLTRYHVVRDASPRRMPPAPRHVSSTHPQSHRQRLRRRPPSE
jgi:hypothetical protein